MNPELKLGLLINSFHAAKKAGLLGERKFDIFEIGNNPTVMGPAKEVPYLKYSLFSECPSNCQESLLVYSNSLDSSNVLEKIALLWSQGPLGLVVEITGIDDAFLEHIVQYCIRKFSRGIAFKREGSVVLFSICSETIMKDLWPRSPKGDRKE